MNMLELVYSSRQSPRPSWAEASDRDLLMAVRKGEEPALNELIGRKTKPLLQLCQRILGDAEEARDVVQVTFFKVWENRGKFDDRWSPNTWIYRIASNLAIDHLRSRKSRERSHEPVRQHLRQVADGRAYRDLSRLQQTEVSMIFRELSAGLSEKQRMVFLLRELRGPVVPRGGRDPRLPGVDGAQPPVQREKVSAPGAAPALPRIRRRLRPRRRRGGGLVLLSCPDWSRLAAARSALDRNESAEPEGWAEAVAHFDACILCRKDALKADPLLVFRRMATVEITPAEDYLEIESMQQAVAAMRTARRLETRGRFAGWRRWAAAAVLAGVSLSVGGDIGPNRAPQLEPVLDGIDRPEARVYQVGDDEFSAVMVIDESYESLDV